MHSAQNQLRGSRTCIVSNGDSMMARRTMLSKSLLDRIAVAEELLKAWSKVSLETLTKAHQVTAPLYHYTTAAGLQGILCDQKFRCTSIFHLNDPSEIEHGMSLVRAMFRELKKDTDDMVQAIAEAVEAHLALSIRRA